MMSNSMLKGFAMSLILIVGVRSQAQIRCEQALSQNTQKPWLAASLGISKGSGEKPLGLQVVSSRSAFLEKSINAIATWIAQGGIRLGEINKVTRKFLEDQSSEAYFVRLARAFEFELTYDEARLKKMIPAGGPVIVVANHPRNGADGIALAAAISKVRPDLKIAMTLFLQNYPGLGDHAVFLNPYGGAQAREFNQSKMKELEEHLLQSGVVIVFASGDVSDKKMNSGELPVDPRWRNGVAQLLEKVPAAVIVPTYIAGSASNMFYRVRQSSIGFLKIIFHVREISNNIGREFQIKMGQALSGKELIEQFGSDQKSLMQYLRARTYLNAGESRPIESSTARKLEPIVPAADPILIKEAIEQQGLKIRSNRGIDVYRIEGQAMSDFVLQELGRARESVFRSVGEGSGKASDFDSYDRYYVHFLALDAETHQIIGAYRLGQVDKILKQRGAQGVYTSEFFDHQKFLQEKGSQMLELGRSFVDPTAGSKAVRALDNIWKGMTAYIAENPHYRYLIGPVSISNTYSKTSQLLMLNYLERFKDNKLAAEVRAKNPVHISSQFQNEINLVAQRTDSLKELNKIVNEIDGVGIPSLLISYGKLGAKYLSFNFDRAFNSLDGLIVVDLKAPEAAEEAAKHFEDRWESYRTNSALTP